MAEPGKRNVSHERGLAPRIEISHNWMIYMNFSFEFQSAISKNILLLSLSQSVTGALLDFR